MHHGALALFLGVLFSAPPAEGPAELTLFPASFPLHGKAARQRLLVTPTVAGKALHAPRAAQFRTDTPGVVQASREGTVTPVAAGMATVTATVDGRTARATVRVSAGDRLLPVTFEKDVEPLLAHAGCNSGP